MLFMTEHTVLGVTSSPNTSKNGVYRNQGTYAGHSQDASLITDDVDSPRSRVHSDSKHSATTPREKKTVSRIEGRHEEDIRNARLSFNLDESSYDRKLSPIGEAALTLSN